MAGSDVKIIEDRFDEPHEPSVTSSNSNERKLARRIRIQRRLEAQTHMNRQNDIGEEEIIIEKSSTQKQIDASDELLEKLISEGEEAISNVRIANDAREIHRRNEESDIRRQFLERLEQEAMLNQKKYKEVNSKWAKILASRDPLDIYSDINAQNSRCAEILNEKDRLINELKRELMNADSKFTLDQKKQNEDINLLIERIDNQIITMANAYRLELVLIDKNIEAERKLLLATNDKKWDMLHKQRYQNEIDGIESRKQIMLEYDAEMKRVMNEHQEEYRLQRIQLETDQQTLQRQLQEMKVLCLMNIEKLDHNYTVLKRREDENLIIKNQQKRRINKLQDIVNSLKKSYTELDENTRMEIQKLTEHVIKAHKGIAELVEKSDHFTKINEKRYLKIWNMNVNTINELVNRIFTVDQMIYKHAFGLEWEPPEKSVLTIKDLPSYCAGVSSADQTIRHQHQKNIEVEQGEQTCGIHTTVAKLDELKAERRLLHNILIQISDHSGFLIEDDLKKLLLPYLGSDKNIVQLDHVFEALSIKSETEIAVLLRFFRQYTYCALCHTCENGSTLRGQSNETSATESSEDSDANFREIYTTNNQMVCGIQQHLQRASSNTLLRVSLTENKDSEYMNTSEKAEDEDIAQDTDILAIAEDQPSTGYMDSKRALCNKGHPLVIQNTYVMRALREFLAKNHSVKLSEVPLSFNEKLSQEQLTISRNLSIEDVTEFWKRYKDIFTTKKEKLWDGLLIGLQKYHELLKERHKLNIEIVNLRKQNAELHKLLDTFMGRVS